MRKLIVFSSVGMCGMDGVDALLVPDDWTEEQIGDEVWQMALKNAEMFGYYPEEDRPEDMDDDDDEAEYYVSSIDGYYEEYDPEKHDIHRSGGGSFEEDFERL